MKVVIYSDGAADPNPGYGGWAAVLLYGEHEKVLTGNSSYATNNQMELQAALSALQALKRPSEIEFHTDSQYVRRGITEWIKKWANNGWVRDEKPIPNAELWQSLSALVGQHQIEWFWVRGHTGNPFNERVDQLAREARLAITPQVILPDNVLRLYTHASCQSNPGPGTWQVQLEQADKQELFQGSVAATTNNRMELTAVIEGLKRLSPETAVQIFTTSDYVYQGITQWIHGWRKRNWQKKEGQPIANADLWQTLDQLTPQYNIFWVNAKGK